MGDLAFARPSKPLRKFMADFGPTHAFLVDKGMAEYTTTGSKKSAGVFYYRAENTGG
jgi:hypothetical protein